MGGKAKPTKHTAAELARKKADALTNKGGGKAGAEDRKGGKAGHSKFQCPVCKMAVPDMKTMQIHYDSKHPKAPPLTQEACTNLHETHGGTTQGVAVRGSTKYGTAQEKKAATAGGGK